MELEKFIEKDIIEFLDIEISKERKEEFPGLTREEEVDAFSLTRDYSKEVRLELASSNLPMAAKIFNQLKEEYEKFPRGSADQLKAYEVMIEVRSQIINFLHHSSLYPDPENALKQSGVILPDPPVLEDGVKVEKAKEIEIDFDKEKIMGELEEKLNKIQLLIENRDRIAAINLYEDIKKLFMSIPDNFEKEKERIFDHVTTVYYQIKKIPANSDEAQDPSNPGEEIIEDVPIMPGADKRSEPPVLQTEQEIEDQIKEIDQGVLDEIEEKVGEAEKEVEAEEEKEKKVLDQSIIEEPEISVPAPEKELNQSLIDEIETKIGEAESEAQEQQENLDKTSNPLEEKVEPEVPTPGLNLTEKQIDEIEEKVEESEVVEEEKEDLEELEEQPQDPDGVSTEEVLAHLEEVKELVKKRNVKEAFEKYKETKKLFADINAPFQAKEELFKDILAVYKSIRELERNLINRKQRPKPAAIIEEKEEPSSIDKINKLKLKTYKYLDKSEIKSAIIEYNKLKELFQQLPDDDNKERVHHELMDLHDRIEDMKNAPVSGELRKQIKDVNLLIEHNKMKEAQQAILDLEHKSINTDEEEKESLNKVILSLKSKTQLKTGMKSE